MNAAEQRKPPNPPPAPANPPIEAKLQAGGEAQSTAGGSTSLERPAAEKSDSQPVTRREAPAKPVVLHPTRPARRAKGRSYLRAFLMLGGIAAVAVAAGIFWLRGGRFVSADDAYVRAAKLMVSTDVSGLVTEIDVHEGEKVAANQVLFKVDPRQYEIALAQAQAQLGQIELTLNSMKADYRAHPERYRRADRAGRSRPVQLRSGPRRC